MFLPVELSTTCIVELVVPFGDDQLPLAMPGFRRTGLVFRRSRAAAPLGFTKLSTSSLGHRSLANLIFIVGCRLCLHFIHELSWELRELGFGDG
uniref:Uncharacterized protein n=1 Tax=Salix viminalis TaxID=40686 RepID=A0A6N2KZ09_SALVM